MKPTPNIALLDMLNAWFEAYVATFLQTDDNRRENFILKRNHTRRVRAEIVGLAKHLDLSREDRAFAECLALMHDVGRFDQYARYGTFSDKKSENHAALSVRVIETHNLLSSLTPESRDLFFRCIRYHNRMTVPDDESDRCQLFSRMLRDADKLDIWRVVTRYYTTRDKKNRNTVLELDTGDSEAVSARLAESVIAGGLADVTTMQTAADFKVLQMSWVFDLNFSRSYRLVDSRRYLETLRKTMKDETWADPVYQSTRSFLDAQLAREY